MSISPSGKLLAVSVQYGSFGLGLSFQRLRPDYEIHRLAEPQRRFHTVWLGQGQPPLCAHLRQAARLFGNLDQHQRRAGLALLDPWSVERNCSFTEVDSDGGEGGLRSSTCPRHASVTKLPLCQNAASLTGLGSRRSRTNPLPSLFTDRHHSSAGLQ